MNLPNPTFNDDNYLWAAAVDQLIAERRYDRSYDEQSPTTLLLPDHSAVASFDRSFVGAATRAAIELWHAA